MAARPQHLRASAPAMMRNFPVSGSGRRAACDSRASKTLPSSTSIEIVDRREDNTDRAKACSNVEDMINAHPDLKLCVGLWSYNGPAIAAAIEALGKQGHVLGAVFDEEAGTLFGIERGSIQVTVVQSHFRSAIYRRSGCTSWLRKGMPPWPGNRKAASSTPASRS
jgi:ABC-type sugar transport system substrate-binding protein